MAQVAGTAPPSVRGFPSVVLLRPEGDVELGERLIASPPVATDTLVMDQITMTFFPGLLIMRPGQTVEFRNSETTAAHNVRVTYLPTDSTLFNVGTAQGIPYRHSFQAVGGYHVTCDIHPGMDAALLVTDAPLFARADDSGAFRFSTVPPGSYVVEVWSMDPAQRSNRTLQVGNEPVQLDLKGLG